MGEIMSYKSNRYLTLLLATIIISIVYPYLGIVNAQTSQPRYENILVLITPANPVLLDNIVKAFKNYSKARLGVDVDVKLIQVGSPEAMNRIIAWGGKPDADLFFDGDILYHWKVKEKGLLESYKPNSPYYDKLPYTFMGLPLRDRDEQWHPALWWGHGFMYNTEVLKKLNLQPPRSWDELLDPKWKDLIVMCTPSRSSSTYINVMAVIQNKGLGEGLAFWRRVAANVGAFVQRSHDVLDLVSKGEYAVGFIYAQGVFLNRVQGYPVDIYLDPLGFIASGVSLLRGAPHPNIAKAFIDWWYTPEAQIAALKAGAFPVIPDVRIEGPEGSIEALLNKALGGKTNIYDYMQSLGTTKSYNYTLAEQMYANISTWFDNSIVARHSELKDAWYTILDAQSKIKGSPDAEAKLRDAIRAFDSDDYAKAKSLALEAASIAGSRRDQNPIYMIILAAAIVIAALAVFLIFRARR